MRRSRIVLRRAFRKPAARKRGAAPKTREGPRPGQMLALRVAIDVVDPNVPKPPRFWRNVCLLFTEIYPKTRIPRPIVLGLMREYLRSGVGISLTWPEIVDVIDFGIEKRMFMTL